MDGQRAVFERGILAQRPPSNQDAN